MFCGVFEIVLILIILLVFLNILLYMVEGFMGCFILVLIDCFVFEVVGMNGFFVCGFFLDLYGVFFFYIGIVLR